MTLEAIYVRNRGGDRVRAVFRPPASAQQAPQSIDNDDIGGVVTGPNGPEAGVWVIAETTDLPTRLIKSVVTDDQGRYVIPDLPKANYEVFVRGYGLVDSAQGEERAGQDRQPHRHGGRRPRRRPSIYPAIYWYSMLKMPAKHEFPLGNVKTQAEWLNVVKTNGCYGCHALGNKATRTIPSVFADMKSEDAWARRILSGQAMNNMATAIGRLDAQRALKLFADWTDRIAAGELPAAKPPRPQGSERNVVITQWDFSDPKHYLHDITATDKRKPTVNANGLIYGAVENSTDIDPGARSGEAQGVDVQDAGARSEDAVVQGRSAVAVALLGRGGDLGRPDPTHNPMYDEKGRVWFTSRVGPPPNPDFCRKGSDHPSAKVFPMDELDAALAMFDPKTGKITLIRTCYPDASSGLRRGRQQHAVAERGRAGQRRARLARNARYSRRPATRRRRRAGRRSCSTPTATASATNGSSRTSRSIRPRTSASSARSTASASIRRTARSGARC